MGRILYLSFLLLRGAQQQCKDIKKDTQHVRHDNNETDDAIDEHFLHVCGLKIFKCEKNWKDSIGANVACFKGNAYILFNTHDYIHVIVVSKDIRLTVTRSG